MSKYPVGLEETVDFLKGLPGIGRRSAERIALSLLNWPQEKLDTLAELLHELKERVTFCPECHNLAEDGGVCDICASAGRDRGVICVVEDPGQIINIEKTGLYHGVYHVLGGKLAPLQGKGPDALHLDTLRQRLAAGNVHELIIALSSDVEGRATALYLADQFQSETIKITRLASGLPAGSDISFADSETIAAAFSGRVKL